MLCRYIVPWFSEKSTFFLLFRPFVNKNTDGKGRPYFKISLFCHFQPLAGLNNAVFQFKSSGLDDVGLAHADFLGTQFAGHIVLDGGLNGEQQVIGACLIIVQSGHAQGGVLLHVDAGGFHQGALYSSDLTILELAVGHELAGEILLDELVNLLIHILHLHGVDDGLTGTGQAHTVVGEELGAQQGHHSQNQNNSDQVDDVDLTKELAFIINDTHK